LSERFEAFIADNLKTSFGDVLKWNWYKNEKEREETDRIQSYLKNIPNND